MLYGTSAKAAIVGLRRQCAAAVHLHQSCTGSAQYDLLESSCAHHHQNVTIQAAVAGILTVHEVKVNHSRSRHHQCHLRR